MTTLDPPPADSGGASSYRIDGGPSVSPDPADSRRDAGRTLTVDQDTAIYSEVQATDEFQGLRRALRGFVFPATVVFLGWYLLYVLMSGFARGFMATKLFGNINIAYVFGLLQFVSTFVIAYVYSKYAEKNLDPTADRLRARIEGDHR